MLDEVLLIRRMGDGMGLTDVADDMDAIRRS